MNILSREFFILAVLLYASTIKIAAMDGVDEVQSPFAPLQALCNECINDTSIEKAFKDSFDLICAQVIQHTIQQHDHLDTAKHWLQNTTTQKKLKNFVTHIQNTISHQIRPWLWPQNEHYQRNHAQDFLYYTAHLFQTVEKAAAQFDKKNHVLTQFLNQAISTGQAPLYLYDVQLLQDAIEQEISCWTSIKKSCTLV